MSEQKQENVNSDADAQPSLERIDRAVEKVLNDVIRGPRSGTAGMGG